MQGEDHSRLLDEHRDRFDKLQQAKQVEVSQLKGTEGHTQRYDFFFVYEVFVDLNPKHRG